jgi:signal transduction histidine kinase
MNEQAQQHTGDSITVPDVVDLQTVVDRLERQGALLAEAKRLARLGSWEWEVGEERVSWSDELVSILGRESAGDSPGFESYLECVHPDDRSGVWEAVERAMRDGSTFEFAHRVVHPDGGVRTVDGKGRVHLDADGAPARVVGTAQDVTERERAADERAARRLAEDEARRSAFLAAAGKLLARGALDLEGTLRSVARLAVESESDWCAVDLVDSDGAIRRAAVDHRDPASARLALEIQERYPPGPESSRGAPAVIRTGRPELLAEIPDALLESEARDAEHLRLLRELRLRSSMIVPLEARGRTLGALTFVASQDGRRFTERDLHFAMELAARSALAIDNARLYEESVEARMVAEEQAVELELQAEELQAQAEELEMQAEELQAQTETLQSQARELEEANAVKSNFLAVMSHELRTPLNAISGYRELLDMEVHGPITPAQRDALARIQVNQRHLLRLINDVLSFTRLEAGLVHCADEVLDVASLLEGMRSLVEPQMAAKGLSYRCDGCDGGLRVRGDRGRIEQVLLNLLANAVKFTPTGGTVELTCHRSDGDVRFRVSDSGPGVEPDKRESIFDPFVQVGRGAGSENQGVGLGLAISRDLATAMGGTLTLESSSPSGSTFTLSLPGA